MRVELTILLILESDVRGCVCECVCGCVCLCVGMCGCVCVLGMGECVCVWVYLIWVVCCTFFNKNHV